MPDTTLVEYDEWDDDTFEAESAKLRREATFGKDVKIPTGETTYRFLPAPKGKGSPFVIEASWWFDDPGGEGRFPVLDVAYHFKTRDPIAEAIAEARTLGHHVEADEMEKARSKTVRANVVIRGEEEQGAQRLSMSLAAYDELRQLRTDYGNFAHPATGFDVKIRRTGKERKTRYKAIAVNRGDATPLEDMTLIERQHNIWDAIQLPDPDRMRRGKEAAVLLLGAGVATKNYTKLAPPSTQDWQTVKSRDVTPRRGLPQKRLVETAADAIDTYKDV